MEPGWGFSLAIERQREASTSRQLYPLFAAWVPKECRIASLEKDWRNKVGFSSKMKKEIHVLAE
ncbi:hypothetical protein [Merdimmobilis hominis]|jgi:hypothetical protein|uniref:hypothetical protein n=1 Tax=Merdimmobilis hominis TaxID=2897707 RepID=UPI001899DA64|nr:hypothetical protein [Merdimmobilis hominis]